MASFRAPLLYTETRLNLDQAHAGSTIDITLSKTSTFERKLYNDVRIGSDEAQFTREHIANDASLYFRRDERYPRAFLWRLLDDRHVLELQSVDLSQERSEKTEAILTLLLRFPAAVRPFCLAFADPDEKDALSVFAITTSNELWTLTLNRDFFIHPRATENLPSSWCTISQPSTLKVQTPFRLFASNARELYTSMVDGQLVRLTRKAGEDGSKWHDIVYSKARWGSTFGAALSWRTSPTIKYGDLTIDPSAALSIVSTSFDEDVAFLVTICVDHTLRIWNMKTGRISVEVDIMDEDEQKYFINANQRQLLQVVEMPGHIDEFYVVTYSPKYHRFKFWAIHDADGGRQGMREMRSSIQFTPPIDAMMDTAVWNLEEFHLRPSRGAQQTELWIRVRSGQTSQVFMLTFDPFDFPHKLHEIADRYVRDVWAEDWVTVSQGRQALELLDEASPANAVDLVPDTQIKNVTEQWLTFLLYPGRFTVPLLETALETFITASKLISNSKGPLKDRLTKAVCPKVATVPNMSETERRSVHTRTKAHWQNFYSIVRDLYKRRADVTSFVVDPWDQLPWIVSTDSISPVRKCSELETADVNREIVRERAVPNPKRVLYSMDHADDESQSEDEDVDEEKLIGNLHYVAYAFREPLGAAFQESFRRAITADIVEQPSSSIADRIHAIQEKCSFFTELSEEDEGRFDDIVTEFGGYQLFYTEKFLKLLETLDELERGRDQDEQITRFGAKMLVRTAQETVNLNVEVLLNLLALVLYLEGGFEPDELSAAIKGLPEDMESMEVDGASSVFNSQLLFEKIIKLLRENIILDFLTTNVRKEHPKKRRKSLGESPLARTASGAPEPIYSSTLLESMFIGDWTDVKAPEEISIPDWITYTSRAWLSNMNVSQYENFSAHVLADLVKHGDAALGEQFLPFVPLTGWSSYLKARLYLEGGKNAEAAVCFQEAGFANALGMFDVTGADTAELLRPDQVDKFSDGLPSYYEHVMDLLGQVKASAQVAEFAKLALQAHNKDMEKAAEEVHHGKPMTEKQKADEKTKNDKRSTDLLSRLFTSSIQISHYDDAYTALTQLPASGVRHFCLQQFIKALVESSRVTQLFAYPWAQLASEADDELAKQARKSLSLSAKPEYYKILYAWRLKRGDYRGAAQAAFERLERLRGERRGRAPDPGDEGLVEGYLLLINCMAGVGEGEAWVVRQPVVGGGKKVEGKGGRGLVTLADVRREYADELDRLAGLEQGRFAFTGEGADEMDVL